MDWKSVELPESMKLLPKDKRGYPVPFVVMVDEDGKPNFRLDAAKKVQQCMLEHRCGICGQTVPGNFWLVGSYMRAADPAGYYVDAPLHKECATYALQVCPFLAAPSYTRILSHDNLDKGKYPGMDFDLPQRAQRFSDLFVLACTSDYVIVPSSHSYWNLYPVRPFVEMEYWQHGKLLSEAEAATSIRNAASIPFNFSIAQLKKFYEKMEGGRDSRTHETPG